MMKHSQRPFDKVRRQSGGSLVEYALILTLICAVTIAVLRRIGTNANNKLEPVNTTMTTGDGGGGGGGGGGSGGGGGGGDGGHH